METGVKVTKFHLGRKFLFFSIFIFTSELMLEQALTNLIVCLMISQKLQLHKQASK